MVLNLIVLGKFGPLSTTPLVAISAACLGFYPNKTWARPL